MTNTLSISTIRMRCVGIADALDWQAKIGGGNYALIQPAQAQEWATNIRALAEHMQNLESERDALKAQIAEHEANPRSAVNLARAAARDAAIRAAVRRRLGDETR